MVLDGLDIGGTETHVLTLSKELLNLGVNIVVVGKKGKLYNEFMKLGCPIYTVNNYKSSESQLLKLIEYEKINIVHLHHPPSGLAMIQLLNRYKVSTVFTIHGLYYRSVMPILNKCNSIISVSEPVKNYLEKQEIASVLIPNGVDLDSFYPKKRGTLKKELDIPEDAFVFTYVSRLEWGKLQACRALVYGCEYIRKITNKEFHLVIIGNGKNTHGIINQCENINKKLERQFIHIIGDRLDLRNCYIDSDCVVGSGRVALEAMACGKPVIALGNHGYFGLIKPDVFNEAWKYYFGDHSSNDNTYSNRLIRDLKLVINSKQNFYILGNEGREWVEKNFNIRHTAKEVLKLYKSII